MTTEGNLGIIACPILEDEIIYCLQKDKGWKRTVLVRNSHSHTIESKLQRYKIPYEVSDEEALLNGGLDLNGSDYNIVIWMKDLALHEDPKFLRKEILDSMVKVDSLFDSIILFYGLCGNGLEKVEEWGGQNLQTPVTILKDVGGKPVDDCISAAIGGQDQYLKLLRRYPGVFYLTPAYATNIDDLIWAMEMTRGVEKGDTSFLKLLFEMADYSQVLKIPTGLGDKDDFEEAAKKFAAEYDFNIITLEKEWCTTEVVDGSWKMAKDLMAQGRAR